MKTKTYLRVVEFQINATTRGKDKDKIEIFRGDMKKDRKYWRKYHNGKARYFKLGKELNK